MLKNFDRIFSLYDRDCQTSDRYYTSERAIHGLLGIGVLSTFCFVFRFFFFFLFCVKSKSVHGPNIECSVRSPWSYLCYYINSIHQGLSICIESPCIHVGRRTIKI